MTTAADVIVRELQFRLGTNVPVVAIPGHTDMSMLIRIGDNPFTQFSWRAGEPFTPEIAQEWCRHYIRNMDAHREVDAVRGTYQWVQVNTPPMANNVTIGAPLAQGRVRGIGMPAMTVERTPLQEARLRELGEMQVLWNPAQSAEHARLSMMLPATPVVPQRRIRVRVIRDDNGYWQVTVQVGEVAKELPKVAIIKALLPPGEKHFIPNRQGRYRSSFRLLQTALESGLSAQSLHDSLKAWAIATEGAATNVQSDSPIADESQIELLRAQPATLEVGGKVYKLVPCGEIDVRPLITRVRTRALATARVEGEAIKTRATTDARLVVSQAEASAQAIRREVEDERRRLGNPIPEWVKLSGREHKWDGSNWRVMLRVICKVDKVRLMVSAWETILWWDSLHPKDDEWYINHKMPVWLRLHPEGVYTLNDVSMKGEWETTHIASYCCMELQGLPAAITTNDLCVRLENGLSRGMMIINLNSPLGVHTQKYWPDFKNQIPTVPLRFLESGGPSDSYLNPGRVGIEEWKAANPRVRWDSEESTRAEAEGVFITVREYTNATPR